MIAAAIIAVIAFSFAWEYLAGQALKNALRVTFEAGSSAAYAGGEIIFTEIIENRGGLPVPSAEVCFRTEKGLRFEDAENIAESDHLYKRDIFSMMGRERVIRRYRVKCLKRGRYRVSQACVRSTSFPFHRVYEQTVSTDCGFLVYAAETDISAVIRSAETILAQRESERAMYEDPFAFSHIREYRLTDPMRSVNWKAAARMDELMVNTYRSTSDMEIDIFLDVSDRALVKREALTEECISVAATLMRAAYAGGMRVHFTANVLREAGGHETPAEYKGGEPQRARIEQFLTLDFGGQKLADMNEILARKDGGYGIPIIISKNVDDSMLEAASKMRSAVVVDVALAGTRPAYRARGGVRVIRREVPA